MLLEYVADANKLADTPRFYNSLTTNCTTAIVKIVRLADVRVPFDWRLIVNGFLPDYLYESGVLNQNVSLAELRRLGAVRERVDLDLDSGTFSAALRVGVPEAPAAGD